ncbi:MAG: trypsin-like peptidase domain-containing protein [Planctomycetes bacterium]|nr:trypsin-like peptidase domain-containing protein [Planctomycetota bacterium]
MALSWKTVTLLAAGGAACVAAGMVVASTLAAAGLGAREPLWREPVDRPVVESRLPSFREVVDRVGPAVVSVRAQLPIVVPPGAPEDQALRSVAARPERRTGSGFVIHERGLVVTSLHVIAGATEVEVYLPNHGGQFADVIGRDAATDLALLRLVAPPPNLPHLELGDSDALHAGDWIVAVGNPFGLARTVTAGLVSFVGRHLEHSDLGVSRDFLQISAAINPGSSGCPVFDVHGHVVGVATQHASAAQGISFAVPVRAVKWALEQMRQQPDGVVRRGYLGIAFAPRRGVDESGRPLPGAVIVEVKEGEPAARAGLRKGDIVLAVDDQPIVDPKDLHERIVCGDPGSAIALQLLRDERACDPIVAVLGEVGGRGDAAAPN